MRPAWIVVPVKAPGAGKTRLAGVLDPSARRALVRRMLAHVVDVAAGHEVRLIGPSCHGLPLVRLADPGGGLDGAAAAALAAAVAAGVPRLVLLSADLPLLVRADVAALLAVDPDTIAIAPDAAGQGTNALSLPVPAAAGFRFGYGLGSFAAHRAAAARLGLAVRVVNTPGLARDIDSPADLAWLSAARIVA
jgi:2-phospho-L-lactate/phosphoenolpyruvate guanylyltransferase